MKAPKVDRVTRRRLGPHTSHLSQSSLASDSIFTISHITNPDSTSVRVHTKQDRAEAREAWGAYELGEALRRRDRDRRRERERGYEQRQKRAAKAQGKRKASIEADDDDVSNEDESNEDEEAAKSIRSRSRSVSRGPPTRRTKRKRRRGTSTAGTSAAEDLDQDSEEEEVEEEEKEENQMFYQSEAVVPSDLPDSYLLSAIHRHASSLYASHSLLSPDPPSSLFAPGTGHNHPRDGIAGGGRVVMQRALNGSALMAIGMLLEEHARTLAAQTQP